MLGVNSFTILRYESGKNQLTSLFNCIFFVHGITPFSGATCRQALAFVTSKKPGSRKLPSLIP